MNGDLLTIAPLITVIVGALAVIVFHQGTVYVVYHQFPLIQAVTGAADAFRGQSHGFNMRGIPPLGIPAVLSLAFWGGIWGIVLAALTLVAIAFGRHALGLRARLVQVSFGLLCGGIAGNLTDRLRFGHVIDFLDFHFGSYIYPTFNVADSAICVGVFLYIGWSLKQPAEDDKVPKAD